MHADQKPVSSFVSNKIELIRGHNQQNQSINLLELDQEINPEEIIATAKNSRVEFSYDESIWRLGSLSVGKWINHNSFFLHSGCLLYCSKKEQVIHFSSRKSKATFQGKGTFIVESLENGGFKIIPLEVNGTISTEKGGDKKLHSSRLLLVLGSPSYFGDAYDIDLFLLLKSSRLIQAFPSPLPTFGKLKLALFKQDLRLKAKYNALIGDAQTNDKLDIWALSDEGNDGLDVESLLQK